jgi:vacuolar-type H+-ATPase subunit F/Vma7
VTPGAADPHDGSAAWVIGDAATVRGFELAGLRGAVVASAASAREALARAHGAGALLVLLTEQAAAWLGEALEPTREVTPLVTVIPSLVRGEADGVATEALRRVVRRALGLPPAARGAR